MTNHCTEECKWDVLPMKTPICSQEIMNKSCMSFHTPAAHNNMNQHWFLHKFCFLMKVEAGTHNSVNPQTE
jgi:hypothetical protein